MFVPDRRWIPRIRTSESSRDIPGSGLFTSEEMKRKSAALQPMPSANTATIVRAEKGVRDRQRTP